MAEWETFAVGAVELPLATGAGTSLLQRADPALFYALDFFKSVLTTYLDEAFTEACAIDGPSDLTTAGSIVRATCPYDFVPDMQHNQSLARFPLLALYRTDAKFSERTVTRKQMTDTWVLEYVLPPLTPAQTEIVSPILSAVERVLLDRIELGHDPNYASDAKIFQSDEALTGVTSIRILERKRPLLERAGSEGNDSLGSTFRMLSMTLEVVEIQVPLSTSFEPLDGLDGVVTVDNPNDADEPYEIAEVVVGNQPPP